MSKPIHKTKEREGGYGIREIVYAGYLVMATHRIEHNVDDPHISVAFLWRDVTCNLCKARKK